MVQPPRQPRRIAMAIGVLALIAMPAGAVQAGSDPQLCRVRNVTQDSVGSSLRVMVTAARDGDRLTLRGACHGDVRIDKDMLVRGLGDQPVIVGSGRGPVVRVVEGADVVLAGLSIRGGGNGLLNEGSVELRRVIIRRNAIFDYAGGGIFNAGTMTLIHSRVQENSADLSYGAGIYNRRVMTLVDSVVAGNSSRDGSGGGIENDGSLTLVRSVVRGNTSDFGGGGIYNEGTLILEASSVTGNTDDGGDGEGGGVYNEPPGTVALDAASTVIGNTPDDCHGTSACPSVPPVGPEYPCPSPSVSAPAVPSPNPSQAPGSPAISPGTDGGPISSPVPDPCTAPEPSMFPAISSVDPESSPAAGP